MALVVAGATLCAHGHIPTHAASGHATGSGLAGVACKVLGALVAECVVTPYVHVVPCFALKCTQSSVHPHIFSREWRVGTVTACIDWKLSKRSVGPRRTLNEGLLCCAVKIFRAWYACV